MKIHTNEEGIIVIEEVYNPIILKTRDGEELSIQMRDSGYEMVYQQKDNVMGTKISAKDGIVENEPVIIP